MAYNIDWSGIYLGNFADIDTDEDNTSNYHDHGTENSGILMGTHGGPSDRLANHVTTLDTDSRTNRIARDDDETGSSGTLTYDVGNGSTTQRLDSHIEARGNVLFTDGTSLTDVEMDVIQLQNGDVFLVAFDSYGYLATKAIESVTLVSVQKDDYTGFSQTSFDNLEFVCFASGTLIDTPDGPRAVETLAAGDMVNTLDNGPQAIRWAHSGDHPLEDVERESKPVLIAAGALGSGLPTQDLIVSPQHRVFVGGGGQLENWFKTEAFAPAKSLTSLSGIRHMKGKKSVTWIHFACDRHEVVTANGCLTESLLLGPMVVNGLTRMERKALTRIYGSVTSPGAALNGPPARECLNVGAVHRHLAKCMKEKAQRTAKEIRKWDVDLAMEQWEADRLGLTLSKDPSLSKVLGAA